MLGQKLSKIIKYGKLAFIGRPLYRVLVALELLYCRLFSYKQQSDIQLDSTVTAIIKTFERPQIMLCLLTSIKQYYPSLKVMVVDDSQQPVQLDGCQVITLPYDSGVTMGRQVALNKVRTPYVLLLDDDFVFYRKTRMAMALFLLAENPEIDIMGGEAVNLPSFKAGDYANARLHDTGKQAILPEGSLVGGLPVYAKIANFYLARTDSLRRVGWYPQIKCLDHMEFFSWACGVLLTVFNKELKKLRAQILFNKAYMQKRTDIRNDQKYIYTKYYQ